MNSELLTEARQAQERLIDAEHDVVVARADFYRAVRRLHLHGSSLREVAADLGLSHQRVHQIVEEAGGSRRWLRTRSEGPPLPARDKGDKGDKSDKSDKSDKRNRDLRLCCTFCHKHQKQVRKLIAGPGVFICDGCVTLARRVIADGVAVTTEAGPLNAVPEQQARAQCSFCGKRRDQVASQAGILLPEAGAKKPDDLAVICDECLDLCDEIIAEELSTDR